MGTLQRAGIAAIAVALAACSGTTSSTPTTPDDGVQTTSAPDNSPVPPGTTAPPTTADGVFSSPDGMRARFPGQPTAQPAQIPTEVGTLDVTFYVYEEADGAMTIAAITYPIPPDEYDAQAGLDGAVDGAAANIGGTVLSRTEISRDGLPGRDARIEAPDDFFVRALMFVDPAGPTLYQAQVVGSADYVDGPAAAAFLDSVTIGR